MAIERDDLGGGPSRAWVQMTTLEGRPDVVELALQQVSQQLAPTLRSSDGWRRTLGLRSPDGRQAVVLSVWDDHAALRGSQTANVEVRQRAHAAGLDMNIEHLELVFDDQ